ncbi:MAG: hypothetical protein QXQ81_04575 [Candidatus Thorarchaeota archaeon]
MDHPWAVNMRRDVSTMSDPNQLGHAAQLDIGIIVLLSPSSCDSIVSHVCRDVAKCGSRVVNRARDTVDLSSRTSWGAFKEHGRRE